MLNILTRFLLVSTSLSPVLGAIVVNKIANGKQLLDWGPWLLVALLLVLICWFVLWHSAYNNQEITLTISQFEQNDSETLSFLLAYLLPFISPNNSPFEGQWLSGAYIFTIIILVVMHSGSLHFNPVMGLLGYHFYGIKDGEGISKLLISSYEIIRPGSKIKTVRLTRTIYLHLKKQKKA